MKKHDKKYIEVEGIMRACYDSFLKTGNKAYSDIIALADAVPAADVVEVRHGRWIEADDMPRLDNTFPIRCSLCGQLMLAHPNDENPNFCCNCGAKMDEVEDNDKTL